MKTRDDSALKVEKSGSGVRFTVKAVPGSSRTALAGFLEGALKVRIAAPPEKGKANQMLTEFLAKILGVRKNQITILAGSSSPLKTLQVAEMTVEQVVQTLKREIAS